MELEKVIEEKLKELSGSEIQLHANLKRVFDEYFGTLISINSRKELLVQLLNPEEIPEDTEESSVSENTTE